MKNPNWLALSLLAALPSVWPGLPVPLRASDQTMSMPEAVAPATAVSTPSAPAAPTSAVKPTSFLGVETGPVSGALRAQLDLPEGMGLTVRNVSKNSPAEKSDLRRYDILLKFDDQWLVHPTQLRTLIQQKQPGQTTTVTVIRGGRQQTLTVVLGARPAEAKIKNGRGHFDWDFDFDFDAEGFPFAPDAPHPPSPPPPPPESSAADPDDRSQTEPEPGQNRLQIYIDGQKKVDFDYSALREQLQDNMENLREKLEILRDNLSQIQDRRIVLQRGRDRTTVISLENRKVRYEGPEGSVVLENKPGSANQWLEARDATGQTLWSGELTDESRSQLPSPVQAMLERLGDPASFQIEVDSTNQPEEEMTPDATTEESI